MSNGPMRPVRDAFKGIFKNSLMSFASVIIMMACMLIIGSALLIVINLNAFVIQMQQQDEVVVFIDEEATQAQIDTLGTRLRGMENIGEIFFVSKEEALEDYKSMFPDQQDLFENLDKNNPLRASYHVKVADLEQYDSTLAEIEKLEHVVNIRGSSNVVNTLVSLRQSVTIIGIWIFVILLCVSIFIVSNTVRMSIFSRRTEISIMKYVGATDSYIRSPFVVEGIIIGLIACALAFTLQWYVYAQVLQPLITQLALFQPLQWSGIYWYVLGAFAVFSVLMGVLGSVIPMRKHLHV